MSIDQIQCGTAGNRIALFEGAIIFLSQSTQKTLTAAIGIVCYQQANRRIGNPCACMPVGVGKDLQAKTGIIRQRCGIDRVFGRCKIVGADCSAIQPPWVLRFGPDTDARGLYTFIGPDGAFQTGKSPRRKM